METKSVYKAILYSRVSTTNDEQAESIDNQILLAKNYLAKHPNIVLAEPLEKYSEKISGKSDIRPKFQEMCQRLSRGDIHYLMIKDLKRLSRSVETTYAFFNLMKQYEFEIIQLSSGNIIDSKAFEEVESNLLLGIEALFAQNMVLTQSRYGRTVQRVRCENKILSYKDSTLFGYKWDPQVKDIVIEEEKAEIIRELFMRYVFKNQGILELRKYLSSIGYPYSHVTVSKWLQEGKYAGDWTINRKGSTLAIGQGAKTHSFKRDKSEWVHIERPDLAIIDQEIFDMAQEIRQGRVKKFGAQEGTVIQRGSFQGKHLFAGKVFCAECGSPYRFRWADRNCTVPIYRDSFRLSKRDISETCPNVNHYRVNEKELKEIVVAAFQAINMKGTDSIDIMIDAIALVLYGQNDAEEKKLKEKQNLKRLEKEAEKISNAFVDAAPAMRSRLNAQLEDIENQIEMSRKRLIHFDHLSFDEDEIRNRLSAIKNQISGWLEITEENLDRKKVEKLVSKITIDRDGNVEVSLAFEKMSSYKSNLSACRSEMAKKLRRVKMPCKKTIKDNIQNVLREIEGEKTDQSTLNILNFNRRVNGKADAHVSVILDTSK